MELGTIFNEPVLTVRWPVGTFSRNRTAVVGSVYKDTEA